MARAGQPAAGDLQPAPEMSDSSQHMDIIEAPASPQRDRKVTHSMLDLSPASVAKLYSSGADELAASEPVAPVSTAIAGAASDIVAPTSDRDFEVIEVLELQSTDGMLAESTPHPIWDEE